MADMGLGALIGLIGTGLSAGASQESAMAQLMNLRYQQQNADRQFRLSTATRTDAYGNTQAYDPATNSWTIVLSPTQKAIVGASQTEQLKQLTEDAVRNRLIQEEARGRAQQLLPDYQKALAGYRYDEAPSRASDQDKLYSMMSLADQTKSSGDAQAVGRTLLRQGRGADLPSVLKAADDQTGRNLPGDQLKAYEQSIPQYQQDVAFRQNKYLPVLEQMSQMLTAGGTGRGTPFSTVPQELSATQNAQSSQILQALQQGAGNINTAYGNASKAIANTAPDIKGLASIISAFKQGGRGNNTQYGLVPDNSGATNPDPTAGFDPNAFATTDFSAGF